MFDDDSFGLKSGSERWRARYLCKRQERSVIFQKSSHGRANKRAGLHKRNIFPSAREVSKQLRFIL